MEKSPIELSNTQECGTRLQDSSFGPDGLLQSAQVKCSLRGFFVESGPGAWGQDPHDPERNLGTNGHMKPKRAGFQLERDA